MYRRVFAMFLMCLAVPALASAQRGQRGSVLNVPPVAGSPAEAKVLAVLDRMVAEGELYLAVDADNGRMLRLLVESTGAKHAVEIGTSTGYSGSGRCSACAAPAGASRPSSSTQAAPSRPGSTSWRPASTPSRPSSWATHTRR